MWTSEHKPVVGVFGFSGCAGDQLRLVHMEDELVTLFTTAEIKFFHMAQSHQEVDHVDIALVEGSINTKKQLEELKEIREKSTFLVALGTCACFGGIQYLNEKDKAFEERFKHVYGSNIKKEDFTVGEAIPPQPLCNFVKVDAMVPGCPIEKDNLLPIYTKLIKGIKPQKYPAPVCVECKLEGNDCLLLHGIPCIGPVVSAGCGAICPSHNLPCVGCWGPYEAANYKSMLDKLEEIGVDKETALRKLKLFGGSKAEEELEKVIK
ncbi:MAG: hydrogenase [Candidatus Heimdallarchaeum endolithica]|uniref:Hydrogenase n=1 Tax=Candidatus Heimdallarchaeum endolithica TaxID=2876572 RepID=A0A9Y1BRK0_9ARCH|nr:MAG: hydrogenase [Candidatus Heimdallarchaeum endolithica]